jgi:glycerophosphocholine phosphodiesterase GPCPD1
MVDYYVYNLRAVENEPPCHIGFSYILPSMMTSSEGQVIVPITSSSHRPVGQLRC